MIAARDFRATRALPPRRGGSYGPTKLPNPVAGSRVALQSLNRQLVPYQNNATAQRPQRIALKSATQRLVHGQRNRHRTYQLTI